MNFIEACKALERDNVEYIYREPPAGWRSPKIKYYISHDGAPLFLEGYYDGGWSVENIRLFNSDLHATDWLIKYKEPELKPCPFCGSKTKVVVVDVGKLQAAKCYSCHAQSPLFIGDADAYKKSWNMRDGKW